MLYGYWRCLSLNFRKGLANRPAPDCTNTPPSTIQIDEAWEEFLGHVQGAKRGTGRWLRIGAKE